MSFNRVITTLIYRNKVNRLSEILTQFNRVKTFKFSKKISTFKKIP